MFIHLTPALHTRQWNLLVTVNSLNWKVPMCLWSGETWMVGAKFHTWSSIWRSPRFLLDARTSSLLLKSLSPRRSSIVAKTQWSGNFLVRPILLKFPFGFLKFSFGFQICLWFSNLVIQFGLDCFLLVMFVVAYLYAMYVWVMYVCLFCFVCLYIMYVSVLFVLLCMLCLF